MLSNIVKILYTFTYISHFFLIIFVLKIFQTINTQEWLMKKDIFDWTIFLLYNLWPLIVFFGMLYLCWLIIRKSIKLPRTTGKFRSGNIQDYNIAIMLSQLIPYISILLQLMHVEEKYVLVSCIVLILIFLLLLKDRGSFNISLSFLGYKQYRVSSDSNSYLLVSKRRINNFNHNFILVELNDETLLEV